jgi:hypothetical protein
VEAWFEKRWLVRHPWIACIFLGVIGVFLAGVFLAVIFGFLPLGLDEASILDYICAGLFLSWAIVEWFLDGIKHLFGSGNIFEFVGYGIFLILLGFITLFAREILAGGKKVWALIVSLFKRIKNFLKNKFFKKISF